MNRQLNRQTSKVGRRGTVVIPAPLRRRFKIDEGALIVLEEKQEGVLIRPAVALPLEVYPIERQAEFLLSNAVSDQDYKRARREVAKLGLNPDKIDHYRPRRQTGK